MSGQRLRAKGLTLLEVLVTVAIFAMLFAVLTIGWHQSLSAQDKLSRAAEHARAHEQLAVVLRQVISETLVPAYQAGTDFTGDSKGLLAETSTSLRSDVGAAPLATGIRLDTAHDGLQLVVSHEGEAPKAYPWRFSDASWRYLDGEGHWFDVWPPPPPHPDDTLPLERDTYLPALVAFRYTMAGDTREHELLAAPRASHWLYLEPTPSLGGFSE
jgi:prepilin-type N-terminal cleavage/methylation domain-containing protein